MRIRFRASMLLLAVICGGLILSAPSMAAPPVSVCPGGKVVDPVTGVCWSVKPVPYDPGSSSLRRCLPGRLGLCLGALQNNPIPPGVMLHPAPPAGPAPRTSWP